MTAQTFFQEDFSGVSVNNQTGIGAVPSTWVTYGDGMANYQNYVQNYGFTSDSWFVYGTSNPAALSISYKAQAAPSDRWLVTPAITMPSAAAPAGSTYALTFWAGGNDDQNPEELDVRISTTGTAKADFTTLGSFSIGSSNAGAFMVPLSNYAGQTIHIAFVNKGDGWFLFLDNIKVEVLSNNNLEVPTIVAPLFSESSVEVAVVNTGAEPLTGFEYSYTINGTTVSNQSVSGISLNYSDYYVVNVPLGTYGPASIEFTASNPSGQAPSVSSTSRGSTNVVDPNATTTRTTLLEHFTTALCVFCPAGHERLGNSMPGFEEKIAWVSHHSGYGTDGLTINASRSLEVLFGNGGPFAPAMCLDRNQAFVKGGYDGVVGNVSNENDIRQLFTAASNTPAVATINMSDLGFDPQTNTLTVTVSGQFLGNYEFDRLGLNLYLVQDGIVMAQKDQQATLENYVHNHALRANITTDVAGDTTAFTSNTVHAGDTYSKTYTYTLPSSNYAILPENCRLVAFINNFGYSYSRLNVLNACQSGPLTGSVSIRTADEASINVRTYPNPATEMAYISAESVIRSIRVVNALGQTVLNQENVNADIVELRASEMEPGMYIVTIQTDNGTASQRLNVVR